MAEKGVAVVLTRIHYLQVGALSKNSSFAEEKEWRLVLPMFGDPQTPPENPPQFRAGKNNSNSVRGASYQQVPARRCNTRPGQRRRFGFRSARIPQVRGLGC